MQNFLSVSRHQRVFNNEKTMTDTQTLIRDYVNSGSEAAFRELVARYLDLVHSTAIRLVRGDAAMAEDVAQTVFVDLARLARGLSREVRLGGWLHRHTCFVAAKTLRGERRRQARERQAVEMNATTDHSEGHLAEVAPILDEAINQLGATDRAAVLLRFYERLDFRAVGEALGSNEAAAQKRVTRALEKLHGLLKRRGVTLSAAALGTALTGEAVTAAPAGMAAGIAGTAVAGAAAGTGNTLILLKLMAATKLKSAVLTAVILASVAMPLLVQQQAQARLRQQDETWRRQTNQLAQLTADNERLAGVLAKTRNSQPSADNQLTEILRLRSEVGRLSRDVQEMTAAKTAASLSPEDQLTLMKKLYAARVDRLKQWFEANPAEMIPELQNISTNAWIDAVESKLETEFDLVRAASNLRANTEDNMLGLLASAARKYAKDNDGQFPSDLSQLKPYFKSPVENAILQRYEIVPTRNLVPELQPGGDWAITQKSAVNPSLDLRAAYNLTTGVMADERITNRWNLVR
jgi:RNA polymerase sigma factor (sigma-70 family)